MTAMAVNNEQPCLRRVVRLSLGQEHLLQPLNSNVITRPSILREGNMPAGMLSQKLLLKPLLLDTLGLEDDQGFKNNANRRDTLYCRGPSTGIYCLNWYSIRVLLRGAYDKPVKSLAFYNAAFVGVVTVSGGIQVMVSYSSNNCLILSGVVAFMRSQLVRRPNFDLMAGQRFMN